MGHTPGPWTFEVHPQHEQFASIYLANDAEVTIAMVDGADLRGEEAKWTDEVLESVRANARLIAAAPSLAAACAAVLAAINCNYCNALVESEYGDMLRAALAEAGVKEQ